MKKIFAFAALAAAVLFAGNTANAQLGINVGYAPQTYKNTYTASNGNTSSDTLSMTGFFLGVNYNTNITGDLNVSVGLQGRYNTKSDSSSASLFGLASGKVKRTDNQFVLDIPILFNYGLSLTDDVKLSIFLGPTISYALSGKTTIEANASVLGVGASTDPQESNWYNADEGNMSAFDLSGTIGLNVTFSGIRLYGGYNMGLLNTNKNDNWTTKGSNFFVGLGYNL